MDFDALLDAHCEALAEQYGIDAKVNVGWESGDDFIASKVYEWNEVFTTSINKRGRLVHKREHYQSLSCGDSAHDRP